LDIWSIILRHLWPLDLVALRCVCRALRKVEASEVATAIWQSYLPRLQVIYKYTRGELRNAVDCRDKWSRIQAELLNPNEHYIPITFPTVMPTNGAYGLVVSRDAREYYEVIWFAKTLHNSSTAWSYGWPRDVRSHVDKVAKEHLHYFYSTLQAPKGRANRLVQFAP
jgi:hypothetical protein